MNLAVIEALEGRQLLSVSALAKPASAPRAVGDYVGLATLSTGTTQLVAFDLCNQKGAKVSGTINLNTSILAVQVAGTVNKHGVVRLSAHSKQYNARIIAKVVSGVLSGSVTATGKTHYRGTFAISAGPC